MKTINIEDESPYCDVCGTCGYIGCCGIRNFISEHIKGKTNCKNEDLIISELINLCDYEDEVFKQNDKLKEQIKEKDKEIERLKNGIKELDDMFYETFRISQNGYFSISEWELKDFTDKLKELKEGK